MATMPWVGRTGRFVIVLPVELDAIVCQVRREFGL
jgi:hypothetical protein